MEKNQSLFGKEAQNSCYNIFEYASLNPWIPIVPDSDKGPWLDKEWEENDYSFNRQAT
ncbi:MAG: hypothetical protein AB1351_03100 [Thermoproteota archaeon]